MNTTSVERSFSGEHASRKSPPPFDIPHLKTLLARQKQAALDIEKILPTSLAAPATLKAGDVAEVIDLTDLVELVEVNEVDETTLQRVEERVLEETMQIKTELRRIEEKIELLSPKKTGVSTEEELSTDARTKLRETLDAFTSINAPWNAEAHLSFLKTISQSETTLKEARNHLSDSVGTFYARQLCERSYVEKLGQFNRFLREATFAGYRFTGRELTLTEVVGVMETFQSTERLVALVEAYDLSKHLETWVKKRRPPCCGFVNPILAPLLFRL